MRPGLRGIIFLVACGIAIDVWVNPSHATDFGLGFLFVGLLDFAATIYSGSDSHQRGIHASLLGIGLILYAMAV